MELTSIPKIYALGTRFNTSIFDGPVVIEEKIDGSQFSFRCHFEDGKIILQYRSKGQQIDLTDPGMFKQAVDTVAWLVTEGKLIVGATYQCEYLQKPKHNVLCYSRIPHGHLVVFDIRLSTGMYLNHHEIVTHATALGLEPVKLLHSGPFWIGPDGEAALQEILKSDSQLGGCKIEGVVIKNYSKPHPEREDHPMTAKFVSPQFKERQEHQPRNPKAGTDPIQGIVNSLRTEARWLKALQHLREDGKITQDNSDIGRLVKEVQQDIEDEETAFIKQALFDEFWPEISRGTIQGLALWYKQLLANGMSVYQETVTAPTDAQESAANI